MVLFTSMSDSLISVIVIGTILLFTVSILIIALILESQRKLLRKNREMFLAVMHTQELEQQRIGQDLHDTIGPLMSALRQKLGLMELKSSEAGYPQQEQFDGMDVLLKTSSEAIREACHNLMPGALKQGLNTALHDFVFRFDSVNMKLELMIHGFPEIYQDYAVINVYRIIQELVNNALKYSQGNKVQIYLFSFQPGILQIVVKDNGIGYNPEVVVSKGIGYQNIQNRVKLLEGSCNYLISKPKGLRVHLKFDARKWK